MSPEDLRPELSGVEGFLDWGIRHPLLYLLHQLMRLSLSAQEMTARFIFASIFGAVVVSIVFIATGTSIYGVFTTIFIYGSWAVAGSLILYLIFQIPRSHQFVQPLKIEEDFLDSDETIRIKAYKSDHFSVLRDSFLLRQEYKHIESFADVAIGLNPGEFDHPDMQFDFSRLNAADLEYALNGGNVINDDDSVALTREQSLRTEFELEADMREQEEILAVLENTEDFLRPATPTAYDEHMASVPSQMLSSHKQLLTSDAGSVPNLFIQTDGLDGVAEDGVHNLNDEDFDFDRLR